jgi:hypothetical protein
MSCASEGPGPSAFTQVQCRINVIEIGAEVVDILPADVAS